jgi:hypothetical protein
VKSEVTSEPHWRESNRLVVESAPGIVAGLAVASSKITRPPCAAVLTGATPSETAVVCGAPGAT